MFASLASPPLEPPCPDTPLLCSLPQRRCCCSPFVVAAPPLMRGLPPVRSEGEEMRSEEQAGSYCRCCQLLDAIQAAAPAAVAGELLAAAGAAVEPVQNRSCFVLKFRAVYAAAKMCGAVL
ncbi:uncharacterized protein DS421_17g585450 [Arachis hypogaea]|nr:uncharacterized protein DS421_17g585450 [Arachis hypogaea]